MSTITCIVAEHRSSHGSRPLGSGITRLDKHAGFQSAEFKPFPPGTVRGPYTCGKGNDATGGVQFCVQTLKGWVYFIEARGQEAKARKDAESFAVKHVGT